jgi:hypothetical protein
MIGQTKLRSPFQFVNKILQYFRILSYSILINQHFLIRLLKLIFYTRLTPCPESGPLDPKTLNLGFSGFKVLGSAKILRPLELEGPTAGWAKI